MRNRRAIVRFPVFNGYEVRVILSRDVPATCRRLQADPDCSACFVPDGNRGYLVLPVNVDAGTIAHEASHAVQALFTAVGARRDEETFAYHLDFLVGRIHGFITGTRKALTIKEI
jgi:hypothetical protein